MAEAAAAPAAEAAPPAKKTGLTIGLLVGGLVLGGAAGTFVVAPLLVPQAAAVADSTGEHGAEGEEQHGEGAKDDKEAGAPKLVKLDNIIVNPAGSQGSRFLMASVVLAVESDKLEADLHTRDAELRDKITTVLEVMTMSQLTAPGARDTVKARVTAMVADMVGKQKFKVFLPQFVIQ